MNPVDQKAAKEVLDDIQHTEAPLSIHIDGYYQGFHVGITIRKDDNATIPTSSIMKAVDEMKEKGFKPSWNEDTNKDHNIPAGFVRIADEGRKKNCQYCDKMTIEKRGIGKNDKPYHAFFCESKDKTHTVWL